MSFREGPLGQPSLIAYTRRHRAHRAIAFNELTCADLTARQRAVLARDWQRRKQQEHLAVGAFAMLATELAADGCSEIVLSLVTRAASDEVAHAEVCGHLAEAFLGRPLPKREKGLPKLPPHTGLSVRDRGLLHLVEMCCIGETLTTCFFTESIARTTSAPMREALTFLLEDEIDHGRVGWAHLGDSTRAERARVSAALPTLLERTVGWLPVAIKRAVAGDEQLESYGYLRPSTVIDLYRTCLREVVLAGFDDLGIDIGPAVRHAAKCGILSA